MSGDGKPVTVRELHERLGRIMAENERWGRPERNDAPVYVRVEQEKTPTGRYRRDKHFPIHGADGGQEAVRDAEDKSVYATLLRSEYTG